MIELITVTVIIIIMALLLMPVFSYMSARSEKMNCTANLKTLHAGAANYVQENSQWPQIQMTQAHDVTNAKTWINALSKYGVTADSWVCPTVHRTSGRPNMNDPENFRIDYMATPFDNRPSTPYKWANQPWFLEKGAPHGNGNLLIYSDGRVEELMNVRTIH